MTNGQTFNNSGIVNEESRLLVNLHTNTQHMGDAISKGKTSDNGEYFAVQYEGMIERKLLDYYRNVRRDSEVASFPDVLEDEVGLNKSVTVMDAEKGIVRSYVLVRISETNAREGKISPDSLIGKTLYGKKINDTMTITLPNGSTRRLRITDIRGC
jgi:transcription elongation factor GreA